MPTVNSSDFPSSITKMFFLAQFLLQLFNKPIVEVKSALEDQCQLLSSSSKMLLMKSHHQRLQARLQRSP